MKLHLLLCIFVQVLVSITLTYAVLPDNLIGFATGWVDVSAIDKVEIVTRGHCFRPYCDRLSLINITSTTTSISLSYDEVVTYNCTRERITIEVNNPVPSSHGQDYYEGEVTYNGQPTGTFCFYMKRLESDDYNLVFDAFNPSCPQSDAQQGCYQGEDGLVVSRIFAPYATFTRDLPSELMMKNVEAVMSVIPRSETGHCSSCILKVPVLINSAKDYIEISHTSMGQGDCRIDARTYRMENFLRSTLDGYVTGTTNFQYGSSYPSRGCFSYSKERIVSEDVMGLCPSDISTAEPTCVIQDVDNSELFDSRIWVIDLPRVNNAENIRGTSVFIFVLLTLFYLFQ